MDEVDFGAFLELALGGIVVKLGKQDLSSKRVQRWGKDLTGLRQSRLIRTSSRTHVSLMSDHITHVT